MARSHVLAGLLAAIALGAGTVSLESQAARPFRIEVSIPASLESKALDGRVILVVSRRQTPEPRLAQMTGPNAQPMFGVDVNGLKPGQPAIIDASTRGWPVESLGELPPGDYFVQATFNVYTTVTRADGHTIKVHLDQGEGQNYRASPGNFVTNVEKVRIDPEGGRGREDRVRPEEPAHRTSARHEVRQAHQVQERHPQRLVGNGHLPGRRRSAAGGLGRAPDGALPDHLQPRALPAHVRRDPRDAPGPVGARSRSSASRPPPTASTRTGSPARWAASSSC